MSDKKQLTIGRYTRTFVRLQKGGQQGERERDSEERGRESEERENNVLSYQMR